MLYRNHCVADIGEMTGVPNVHTDYHISMLQFAEFAREYLLKPDEYFNYISTKEGYRHRARNYFVHAMQSDLLLMFDTDHMFDPDIFARMKKAMDKLGADIVTATYVHRAPPFTPVLFEFDDNEELQQVAGWDAKEKGKAATVAEINCAGAGTLLIKKEVFNRIRDEQGEKNPFDHLVVNGHQLGEEFSFFLRVKRLGGIKCFALLFVESYHLYTRPVGLSDYSMPETQA